jgi:hypothetical protein
LNPFQLCWNGFFCWIYSASFIWLNEDKEKHFLERNGFKFVSRSREGSAILHSPQEIESISALLEWIFFVEMLWGRDASRPAILHHIH